MEKMNIERPEQDVNMLNLIKILYFLFFIKLGEYLKTDGSYRYNKILKYAFLQTLLLEWSIAP